MIYNLEKEIEVNFSFDYENVYKNVINAVVEYFNCPYDCEVSLLLVDNASICEINNETRGIDKPTDVLSFPNVDFDVPADFDSIDEFDDIFEPDSGELIIGDIVLSVEKVKAQALEYGHSEMREYAFLICHSALHLLGFDHIEDEDRVLMELKQSEIMDILRIGR